MSALLSRPQDTFQHVDCGSADGRKLLRKIARSDHDLSHDWHATAFASDGWRIRFCRTVDNGIGEPETTIAVMTDATVQLRGKFGQTVQSFSDSEPVAIPTPRRVFLGGSDTKLLADLLSQGASLEIHGSAGSTHSSRHGMAFIHAAIRLPNHHYCDLTIGGQSVFVNGVQVISGTVDC